MKRIPYANGEAPVTEFDLDQFKDKTYKKISIPWLRAFIIELNLPFSLRPYQERIIVKTVNHFIVDKLRCILIESATGSGKTVMGLLIALCLQKLLGTQTSWTTLRRELLLQAHKTNKDLMLTEVLLKTISMMGKNPDKSDVLVVDEAHKDATASMAHVHAHVDARFIILLSATPIRADKATIFYDKVIKDSGIRALIRDGWLSKFNVWSIQEWSPEFVAEAYLRELDKWGKTAVFFHKYEDCVEFARLVEEAGTRCEIVTGKSDRQTQLARFEESEIPVVVNMMVLTEGFDCPSLETVFVRDSQKSTTVQMAGRVLRLWDAIAGNSPKQWNNGCVVKNVVQSIQTDYPFVKECNPVDKYVWEHDVWKKIGQNNMVNKMAKAMLTKMIAHAKAEAQKEKTLKDHMDKKKGLDQRAIG